MKATEMLNKIKTFLGEDTADIVENIEQNQEVKLAQMTLENGTVLEAESFEAGQEVFILTDDEKVALPVGEYELEDGMLLVVAEQGLIAEIKEATEEVEEEVEASEVEATDVEVEAAEEVEAEYATKEELAEVKSMLEEIKAMIDKKEEMSEVEEQVKEELSETPAAEPISHNPEPKQKVNLKYSQNRKKSTFDKVMQKLINN